MVVRALSERFSNIHPRTAFNQSIFNSTPSHCSQIGSRYVEKTFSTRQSSVSALTDRLHQRNLLAPSLGSNLAVSVSNSALLNCLKCY